MGVQVVSVGLLLALVKESTIVFSKNFLQFSSASANPAPGQSQLSTGVYVHVQMYIPQCGVIG